MITQTELEKKNHQLAAELEKTKEQLGAELEKSKKQLAVEASSMKAEEVQNRKRKLSPSGLPERKKQIREQTLDSINYAKLMAGRFRPS